MNDGLHHRAAGLHHLREERAALVGISSARGQFFQIVARGISGTICGDDDGSDAFVIANGIQFSVMGRDHRLRQRIARSWLIKRQHRDGAERFAQQWRGRRSRFGRSRCGCHGEVRGLGIVVTLGYIAVICECRAGQTIHDEAENERAGA